MVPAMDPAVTLSRYCNGHRRHASTFTKIQKRTIYPTGSYHPGVTLFVMGDGGVRPIEDDIEFREVYQGYSDLQ